MVDEELSLTAEEQALLEKGEEIIESPPVSTEEPTTPPPAPPAQEQKLVPLAALHESRNETRELRKQMEEARQKLAVVDKLKEEILSIKEQKQRTPAPDPNDDPIGYTQHKLREQEAQMRKLTEYSEQQESQNQAIKQQQELINTINYQEQSFAKENKDYYDALDYLKDVRRQELELFGITDPKEIAREIAVNTYQISTFALKQDKNPAEIVYGLAKRYGYAPKQATQQTQQASLDDTLKTISTGQRDASKTLSGGGTTNDTVSAEGLLSLEGEDFDKAWKKMFG